MRVQVRRAMASTPPLGRPGSQPQVELPAGFQAPAAQGAAGPIAAAAAAEAGAGAGAAGAHGAARNVLGAQAGFRRAGHPPLQQASGDTHSMATHSSAAGAAESGSNASTSEAVKAGEGGSSALDPDHDHASSLLGPDDFDLPPGFLGLSRVESAQLATNFSHLLVDDPGAVLTASLGAVIMEEIEEGAGAGLQGLAASGGAGAANGGAVGPGGGLDATSCGGAGGANHMVLDGEGVGGGSSSGHAGGSSSQRPGAVRFHSGLGGVMGGVSKPTGQPGSASAQPPFSRRRSREFAGLTSGGALERSRSSPLVSGPGRFSLDSSSAAGRPAMGHPAGRLPPLVEGAGMAWGLPTTPLHIAPKYGHAGAMAAAVAAAAAMASGAAAVGMAGMGMSGMPGPMGPMGMGMGMGMPSMGAMGMPGPMHGMGMMGMPGAAGGMGPMGMPGPMGPVPGMPGTPLMPVAAPSPSSMPTPAGMVPTPTGCSLGGPTGSTPFSVGPSLMQAHHRGSFDSVRAASMSMKRAQSTPLPFSMPFLPSLPNTGAATVGAAAAAAGGHAASSEGPHSSAPLSNSAQALNDAFASGLLDDPLAALDPALLASCALPLGSAPDLSGVLADVEDGGNHRAPIGLALRKTPSLIDMVSAAVDKRH